MTTAKKIALLFPVLLAAAAGGTWYAIQQRRQSDDDVLRLSGNIEVTEVGVSFKIPGLVVDRLVDEGDMVKRDQLIAVLDTSDLEAQAELRRRRVGGGPGGDGGRVAGRFKAGPQEIETAKANLAAALIEKDRLETEWGRARRLFEQKMTSREEYDRAAAAYNVADGDLSAPVGAVPSLVKEGPRKEDIDQGRAKVKQAEAALRFAETQLKYAKIYSPLDGVVLSKNIEQGEYVAPGTPVVTVADLVNVWLRAYVNETDLDRVKLGQAAEITTDAKAGKVLQGPRRLYLPGSRIHAQDRANGKGAGETRVPHQDRHYQYGHGTEGRHAGRRHDKDEG